MAEHNSNQTVSTKNKGPWIIVFCQSYSNATKAKQIELRLKRFKRRDYIEKIIDEKTIKID